MSGFIGTPQTALLWTRDQTWESIIEPRWQETRTEWRVYQGYAYGFWPRSALIGDADANIIGGMDVWWEWIDLTGTGSETRFGIAGVTRDVYGSVLGAVTVRLFRTSTNELVHETVSDAVSGTYLAMTPYYPDAHYIVAYKTGSPDVTASTVNTLIGA